MHFVLCIPPKSATGDQTYYFWVLQKWLHETRDQATSIIIPSEYIPALNDASRWEFTEPSFNFNQYLPSTKIDEKTEIIFYPQSLSGTANRRSPITDFIDLMTKEEPALIEFYTKSLEAIKKTTEKDMAVITWLNNSSLRTAVNIANCRLVFNEFGPFRKPFYRPTAYWDRHGVNGDTEVIDRWSREKDDFASWKKIQYPNGGSTDAIRALLADPLSTSTLAKGTGRAKIGVALQVESDSNALAYGCGWNNLALINYLRHSELANDALLRLHPAGSAIYPGRIDLSPSPLEFLANVEEVWTVNSSLGIEALFWGKRARIFGDSPVNPIMTLQGSERVDFLEWFVICYLVPFDLLFDLEYYFWRFGNPSTSEIAKRHMTAYRADAKYSWGNVPFPPKADERKISVDFPTPRRAPLEFVEQKLDLAEQRGYIAKLEKNIRELYLVADERNALVSERDTLLSERSALEVERETLLYSLTVMEAERDDARAERDHTRDELTAIKSSRPFRFLRRMRLI